MGGYGSGRQNGRPLADSALRIDFAWMLRQSLAVPNALRGGRLSWNCGGKPAGDISYTCDMRDPDNAQFELRFAVTDRRSGEKSDYVQRVHLSYTVPNFGGRRWWMHCPSNGSRVGKLYCPDGAHTFASRTAWGIAYQSQRAADRDRPFEALFRLQRRLGCTEGWEQPIRRPKGMWRRTFERYEERYSQLDRQCGVAMAGVLARLRR
jgi:hypothetical protein